MPSVGDWDAADVRWCLMYPDAYEVGLPNQGLMILYELLNEQPDVLAERTYCRVARSRGADAKARPRRSSRSTGIARSAPSTCSGCPLATELGHTNLLVALDLAGIPLRSRRTDRRPPARRRRRARGVQPRAHRRLPRRGRPRRRRAGRPGDHRPRARAKAEGSPGGREAAARRMATRRRWRTSPASTTSTTCRTAGSPRRPNRPGVPRRVSKHTVTNLDAWPYPKQPLVPLAETRPRADERRDLPGLHARVPLLPGRHDHPSGTRAQHHRDRRDGRPRAAQHRVRGSRAAQPVQSADHSEIAEIAKGLADRYEGDQVSLSPAVHPGRRLQYDASPTSWRATAAAPASPSRPKAAASGSGRVINKTVTEEDLIRTVTTAYAGGWRHVKLYFMCGLPTETDEDVLEIADLARAVVRAGREVTGTRDIRCTVSIGGFIPKPHTPFQWAGQLPARGNRPAPAAAARRDRARPLDRLPLPRRQAGYRRRTALPGGPQGRCSDRGSCPGRGTFRRLE